MKAEAAYCIRPKRLSTDGTGVGLVWLLTARRLPRSAESDRAAAAMDRGVYWL